MSFDDFELPGELDFHIPDSSFSNSNCVALQFDDDAKLHRQLVCWCLIQRYWYNVVSSPQVSDGEYDAIENYVKQMESEAEYLQGNKYSPAKTVASSRADDYPPFVRSLFECLKKDDLTS